jgi:hypothetical protein
MASRPPFGVNRTANTPPPGASDQGTAAIR